VWSSKKPNSQNSNLKTTVVYDSLIDGAIKIIQMAAYSSTPVERNDSSSSLSRHLMDESSLSSSGNSRSSNSINSCVLSHREAKEELEERIKVLQSYFVQKDSNDPVDCIFKTPDKKSSSTHLNQIFGNSACGPLMSEYCDLLVKDAIYSQPFFHLDNQLYQYLQAKVCAPIEDRQNKQLVTQQTLEEFLEFKRNEKTSVKAKMKGQLLLDSYHSQMRICVQNWASLYFNPSMRISMDAGVAKQIWRKNKESSLGRLFSSKLFYATDANEKILGMSKSLK
jgi:hypothetical protein